MGFLSLPLVQRPFLEKKKEENDSMEDSMSETENLLDTWREGVLLPEILKNLLQLFFPIIFVVELGELLLKKVFEDFLLIVAVSGSFLQVRKSNEYLLKQIKTFLFLLSDLQFPIFPAH